MIIKRKVSITRCTKVTERFIRSQSDQELFKQKSNIPFSIFPAIISDLAVAYIL